jgi:folate-binding protein YgfZ
MDEAERIEKGIPKWGAELMEGMLPPEAGLDATDISYSKGCYIGQEVISRIKSAGKVNRRLTKFVFDGEGKIGEITNTDGKVCGEVTSVSGNLGLGYLKRGVEKHLILQVGDQHIAACQDT